MALLLITWAAGAWLAPPGYVLTCSPFLPFLRFELPSAALTEQAKLILADQFQEARAHPEGWIRVTAFSVSSSPTTEEWELSYKRAQAVVREVVRLGVNPAQIEVVVQQGSTLFEDDPGGRGVYVQRMMSAEDMAASLQWRPITEQFSNTFATRLIEAGTDHRRGILQPRFDLHKEKATARVAFPFQLGNLDQVCGAKIAKPFLNGAQ